MPSSAAVPLACAVHQGGRLSSPSPLSVPARHLMAKRTSSRFQSRTLGTLFSVSSLLVLGCGGGSGQTAAQGRTTGQSDFQSVSPSGGPSKGGNLSASAGADATATGSAPVSQSATPRTVEETDLYRLDG